MYRGLPGQFDSIVDLMSDPIDDVEEQSPPAPLHDRVAAHERVAEWAAECPDHICMA